MDLSFISLKKVLEKAWSFTSEEGFLIALVKPQFECKKNEADRGKGVIRDFAIRERVLNEIIIYAEENLPRSELFAKTESSPWKRWKCRILLRLAKEVSIFAVLC